MRGCRKWTLTLAALCVCSVPARAQDKPRAVPEQGAIKLVLLRHRAVRDDLRLTQPEARRVHEFTEQQWKKEQAAEAIADEKERDRRLDEITREDERFLDQTLKPDQRKRLGQITLQVAGLLWVTHPEVADALKLTDAQKRKIADLQTEARKEMEELLYSEKRRDRESELRKHQENCKQRMLGVLTDEQEAKYKELMGEPLRGELKFDEPDPGAEEKP